MKDFAFAHPVCFTVIAFPIAVAVAAGFIVFLASLLQVNVNWSWKR